MKKYLIIAVIIVIIAVLSVRTAMFYKPSKSEPAGGDILYRAIKNNIIKKSINIDVFGRVKSDADIDITSESNGKIKKILISNYAKVSKNQKIAKVDDTLHELYAKSKSNYQDLETDVDPSFNIESKKNINARNSNTERYIISPCDGYVNTIFMESGADITIGDRIASVSCSSKTFILASVSTNNAAKIRQNMKAKIHTSKGDIYGTIKSIGKIVNESGSVDIEIAISPKDKNYLLLNDNIEVKIITNQDSFSQVPLAAIVIDSAGETSVYLADNDGRVTKKQIKIAGADEEFAYTKGLSKDDIIISSALNTLYNDKIVKYELSE